MLPHPPELGSSRWPRSDPKGLFYATKHGLKFTGMPAWPAIERDDEVWAVVAFLLRPSRSRCQESYARLVRGETAPASGGGRPGASALIWIRRRPRFRSRCGRAARAAMASRAAAAGSALSRASTDSAVEYLSVRCARMRRQTRPSGIMGPIAAGIALAGHLVESWPEYYAGRDQERARLFDRHSLRAADAAPRWREVPRSPRRGVPAQGVPSCEDCHGLDDLAAEPRLPGARPASTPSTWSSSSGCGKRGVRGGSPYAHLMEAFAPKLTDDQIRDVAGYYASLDVASSWAREPSAR